MVLSGDEACQGERKGIGDAAGGLSLSLLWISDAAGAAERGCGLDLSRLFLGK